jgi:hypothetical protein
MEVSSRRVRSTHAWRGRLSRRSEISSSAEVGGCGVTTSLLGLAATFLTLAGAFLLGLTVAALVAPVDLGTGFLGLAVFLVAVTFGGLGASVAV